jgi:hypothetical protein
MTAAATVRTMTIEVIVQDLNNAASVMHIWLSLEPGCRTTEHGEWFSVPDRSSAPVGTAVFGNLAPGCRARRDKATTFKPQ